MKTRSWIVLLLSLVISFVFIINSQAQNSALTPQQVREILYGPATKGNTTLQNELIWKEKCHVKEVRGEGTVLSFVKRDVGFSDLSLMVGSGEKWIALVVIEEGPPFFWVSVILDDKYLKSAAALKSGDKVRFQSYLWKSSGPIENQKYGKGLILYSILGKIL